MAARPVDAQRHVVCYPVNIGLSLLHAFGFGLPVVTGNDIGSHNPGIETLLGAADYYRRLRAEDFACPRHR